MVKFLIYLLVLLFPLAAYTHNAAILADAYPESIEAASNEMVVWRDKTVMLITKNSPTLADQLKEKYRKGELLTPPHTDPGRYRYQPFFLKMYGNTQGQVEQYLTTIYWMPKIFGNTFPLRVTTINGVDKKLQCISDELEKLPDFYYPYVSNPSTFTWRHIANSDHISTHSFGIAIDINTDYSHYWQWDLIHQEKPVAESTPLTYQNEIPWEIVAIFEKYGFIWGGKWHHYDTMHFEYRPELLQ